MAEIMGNLKFDDGFEVRTINEDPNRTIRWNPNDVGFVDRFIEFQNWMENEFRPKISSMGITKETGLEEYEKGSLREFGLELEAAIDDVFQSPVSKAAFGGANPLSPIRNGSLLFMNFMDALMPIIEKSIKDFEASRKKYTAAAKRPVKPRKV